MRKVKKVEGVPYYPFLVRYTLRDGNKRRRMVRWSPGEWCIRDEVGRELVERFGATGIKERSVTVRMLEVES